MSDYQTLEEAKNQVEPTETLKVEVVDSTKPINVKVREENGNITEKSYTYKPWVPRWSQLLDWAAEIASGMVLKSYKDENGEDINEIQLTKEYSAKKNKVLTDIVRKTFSLDINVDSIEPDSMFELLKIVEDEGFLVRLERLNPGSSTAKKNTAK